MRIREVAQEKCGAASILKNFSEIDGPPCKKIVEIALVPPPCARRIGWREHDLELGQRPHLLITSRNFSPRVVRIMAENSALKKTGLLHRRIEL